MIFQRLLSVFHGSFVVILLSIGCSDGGQANEDDPKGKSTEKKDAGPRDSGVALSDSGTEETLIKRNLRNCEGVVDVCDEAYTGITWDCQNRFVYGVNYAWRHFGSDFGGVTGWDTAGVTNNREQYLQDLTTMRDAGANVVRWWMFPDFSGDGVTFDATETPTGLGGTVEDDILAAMEIAESLDIYIMFCIFSFNNFEPTEVKEDGRVDEGMTAIVKDNAKRAQLLEKIVRPVAQIVESSPFRHRVMSWDLMNEPEWAIEGRSLYGDGTFRPQHAQLVPVSHAEMERLFQEMIVVLREESQALITVGATAFEWANAWTGLDLDFYQFHMYDWIHEEWPYTNPAETYGLDKPIVMGEYFMTYLDREDPSTPSFQEMTESFFNTGYAGALGWQFIDTWYYQTPEWNNNLTPFAQAHPCSSRYSLSR